MTQKQEQALVFALGFVRPGRIGFCHNPITGKARVLTSVEAVNDCLKAFGSKVRAKEPKPMKKKPARVSKPQ